VRRFVKLASPLHPRADLAEWTICAILVQEGTASGNGGPRLASSGPHGSRWRLPSLKMIEEVTACRPPRTFVPFLSLAPSW
jgi:hypothetical protein